MYLCKTCNLNFKKQSEYNNHIKNADHINRSFISTTKTNDTNLPILTISSDSLSSLESRNENIIKKELLNIKLKLKILTDDLDKILEKI